MRRTHRIRLLSGWVAGALFAVPVALAGEKTISLRRVPEPVAQAVQARFSGAKILEVTKERERGRLVYEVTLDHDGRTREVTLAPDGTILEVETRLVESDLPAAAREAIEARFPGAICRGIEEIVVADATRGDPVRYEVDIVGADGRRREVLVTAAGVFLHDEDEDEDDDEDDDSSSGSGHDDDSSDSRGGSDDDNSG